jgi:hypothetical protein
LQRRRLGLTLPNDLVKNSPSAADKDFMLRLALTLSVAALAAAFAALFGSR